MNIKNNQRYQSTEDRIIDIFIKLLQEKELNKITVSEICRLSGINRTSFYLHYADVYDLMDKIEQQMFLYFGKLFTDPEDYHLGKRFIKLFEFIKEHKDFYKVYLNTQMESHILGGFIPQSASDSLNGLIQKLGFEHDYELIYHQAFFQAGLTALVREWLNRDCTESAEELADILKKEYSPDKKLQFSIHQ